MNLSFNIAPKVRRILLQYRWSVVVLTGVISIIFELGEHVTQSKPLNAHFWREILLFGFVFPGVGGVSPKPVKPHRS